MLFLKKSPPCNSHDCVGLTHQYNGNSIRDNFVLPILSYYDDNEKTWGSQVKKASLQTLENHLIRLV